LTFQGGETTIGHTGNGFCFDNELLRHAAIFHSYQLASRLVTNGEYLEFILSKAYQTPIWWLSDGWDCIQKNQWQAPLYWEKIDNKWYIFTLNGLQEINVSEPVTHISYYEADAYSRWCGARLPSEIEWEHATTYLPSHHSGNFLESHLFHPQAAKSIEDHQLLGNLWEWTASAYMPYPGFKTLNGLLAEYNGKFMSNQMVLRGGSCVTPQSHIRPSYRNFFQPDKRWVFSGIRLAKNLE
jgi:ergothioneine biosynthesis protein EgtB